MNRPFYILPVIILSQFLGTSLWFAGNAVIGDLQQAIGFTDAGVGYITIAVQLGFIGGTLAFAFLGIADRFSPRWVFFWCSVIGALANAMILLVPRGLTDVLVLRFLTGFFLAGIYPVGMKIAAGWYSKGLGRALGYLVGALVLGTAFPHLLKGAELQLPWQDVLLGVSALAVFGGVLMLLFVADGPHLKKAAKFNPRVFGIIFRSRGFRGSAFGYFGHMWELYTFWAFVPVWLIAYRQREFTGMNQGLDVSFWSFAIIAIGVIGCIVGGIVSQSRGSKKVASTQLLISGVCCLLSPLFFSVPVEICLTFLLVWGVTVIGDSPQFSAMNAQNAPQEYVGSALTIVNSIGFFMTVVSIQVVEMLIPVLGPQFVFWALAPGPVLGLLALRKFNG